MTRYTRRDAIRIGATAAAGAALAACDLGFSVRTPQTRDVRDLKVGHLARQLGNLVPQYDEVGPKHGVKFDVSLFPDGAALLQALSTGDILLAAPTKVQLVQAMARGVDLVMVCGYAGGYVVLLTRRGLVATPGSWPSLGAPVTGTRGRPGQPKLRIGVPTASLQHVVLLERLRAEGFVDGAFDIVNVPFNEHANALDRGDIDMAAALSLFAAQALLENKAELFRHVTTSQTGLFEVGFVTTRRLARERADDLQRVVTAHYEAMRNIQTDPTRGLAREVAYSQLPETVVKRNYEFLRFDHRVDVGAIRSTERVMRELGLHRDDVSAKVDEYVDLTFLSKASGRPVAELSTWGA